MKIKYLIIIGLVVTVFATCYKANSVMVEAETLQYQKQEVIVETNIESELERLLEKYSLMYNVSKSEMKRVILCENRSLNPEQQSYMVYQRDRPEWGVKKGEREKSFGLVQIHLPSHPKISYEQAIDPEFSIEFMAKKFSQGRASEWSCY